MTLTMDINTSRYVKSPKEINGVKVVNNINEAVNALLNKTPIARFEYGESMKPILNDGEYGIVYPIDSLDDVKVGDAVLCEVDGYLMTHMVIVKSESNSKTPYFLIGSSHMQLYGWTNKIYGIVIGTDVFEEPRRFDEVEEIK